MPGLSDSLKRHLAFSAAEAFLKVASLKSYWRQETSALSARPVSSFAAIEGVGLGIADLEAGG